MWNFEKISAQNLLSFSDVEYAVKKNKAILISGVNKDDDGQKSNGVGKSSLLEILSLLIVGDNMRGVLMKEIIRNGTQSCVVEGKLRNSITKEYLEIRREFDIKKASTLDVRINGVQPKIVLSNSGSGVDVKEGNKFILSLLGITREDFYNYYVISKHSFVNFFSSSDTKKKEIIAKFSNANILSSIDDKINDEIEENQIKYSKICSELTALNAKLEVYNEQSDIETQDEFEINRKDRIKKLTDSIFLIELDQSGLEGEIVGLNDKIKKEKENLNKITFSSVDASIEEHQDTINQLNDRLKRIEKTKDDLFETKYKSQLIKLKKQTDETNQTLNSLREERNEFIEVKLKLEIRISGAIECPKCSHVFNPNDKQHDIEKTKASFKEAVDTINDINAEIKECEEKIVQLKKDEDSVEKSYRKEIDKFFFEINETRSQITQNSNKIDEYEKIKIDLKKSKREIENNINALNAEIESKNASIRNKSKTIEDYKASILAEQEAKFIDKKIELDKKIDNIKIQISDKEVERVDVDSKIKSSQEWLLIFKSFKNHLANKSIQAIEGFANLYLSRMNSNLSIKMDGFRELSNKKIKEEITCEVLRNGVNEGSYGKFSAGEKGRIDIAVTAALQNLLNLNNPSGGLNILAIDEVLDSVDSLGLELIIKALQNIGITILIVTQNQVENVSEFTLTIEKREKQSYLIN